MVCGGEQVIMPHIPVTWDQVPTECETPAAAVGQFIKDEESWDLQLDGCS